MSRQQYSRRAKRSRPVMELSSDEEEDSISVVVIEDSPSSPSSDEENVRTKSKSKSKRRTSSQKESPKSTGVKLAPIFLARKEREKPKAKPVMSEATKNFLYSGVPEVIAKTQRAIEKKKVEMDLFDTLEIFPLLTHNIPVVELNRSSNPVDFSKSPFHVTSEERMENVETKIGLPINLHLANDNVDSDAGRLRQGGFCCGVNNYEPSTRLLEAMRHCQTSTGEDNDPLPWAEKYKLRRSQHLVVQKDSQKKCKAWLKEWSRDIRDDGGTSRQVIKKRKKGRDSDSDFIEDEEADPEMKNKSVLLTGPTGSGKSTMVQVLAKQYGFKVVEVNFSSRRSGQEVLRRVEEATLSRRLSTGASVDDKHCLLLFRDIDQVYPEEDEGFHSALAQLIVASLRPIVMTLTATHADPQIDGRIESKTPLQIPIGLPSADLIITKVLLPILEREIRNHDPEYDFDEEEGDREFILKILDSIVGHCESDIKKCINQTQLLWYTTPFTLPHVHKTLCPHLETNYVTPVKETHAQPSAPTQEEMDEIAKNLKFLTDLDRMVQRSIPDEESVPLNLVHTYFESNFYSMLLLAEEQAKTKNQSNYQSQSQDPNGNNNNNNNLSLDIQKMEHGDGDEENGMVNLFRNLTFRTPKILLDWKKNDGIYDEIVTRRLDKFVNQEDYDEVAYFRSILKTGIINSIGDTRRNSRIRTHFHGIIGRDLIDAICNNLDFEERRRVANEAGLVLRRQSN